MHKIFTRNMKMEHGARICDMYFTQINSLQYRQEEASCSSFKVIAEWTFYKFSSSCSYFQVKNTELTKQTC